MNDSIKIFIDGACQPNPGNGGIGIFVSRGINEEKFSLPLHGEATNNVAEYEALILETDQIKELITNLNNEVSDANVKIESLEEEIKNNQESIDQLSSEISKNQEILSTEMAHTDKEEQLLVKNIDQYTNKVDDRYLGQYNKLFNKYGQGMARVLRNSCSNCYTQLPAQMLVEIEHDKKLITCPSCSVFLYHKTEEE